MNRRAPLLQLIEPQLISSGLLPDRYSLAQPLWDSAVNVRFYQGKVKRILPASQLFTPTSGVSRGLHQQQTSDGVRWVWTAVGGAIYRWSSGSAELIETRSIQQNETSLAAATYFDFLTWGDWTLYNDGAAIRRYRPGTGLDDLPNAPAGCIALMKKENQLVAVGTGLNRKDVQWCHADSIELWDSTVEGSLAGKFTIEELDTPIRAAARLGQNIACYAEDQMAFVYRAGLPFVFGQRVMLDGIGAVGKLAVCADGRLNYGVSRNGIWRTDGSEAQYIDAGSLSDYIQANVNWGQQSKILAFRNDVTRCIEFHFPLGAGLENSEGWSYDPATGAWGTVPAVQVAQERRLFRRPLGATSGVVSYLDDNTTGTGTLGLKTKPLLMPVDENGASLHVGAHVDEIEFMLKDVASVEFRYSVAEDIDGPWHNTAWQLLNPDQRTYRLERHPTGTFHQLELRSTANSWRLDLQGFAVFGIIEGQKRDAGL